MGKLDKFKQQDRTLGKTLGAGKGRFDSVEKVLFKPTDQSESVEAQPPALGNASIPSSLPSAPVEKTSVEPRKKLTLMLTESDWKSWKLKLSREGRDGQKVLEILVRKWIASEDGGDIS